jgi:hypothetical protein
MEIRNPRELGRKLSEIIGYDIFKNTRRREFVEGRALLVYLLRDKLLMRWVNIAKYFQDHGKDMDHSTCIHLFKMYPTYKLYNEKLSEYERFFIFKSQMNYDEIDKLHYMENKYKELEEVNKKLSLELKKLNNKLNDPTLKSIYDALVNVTPQQRKQAEERFVLLKKSWDWKSVDKCEIIESSSGISGSAF